MGSKLYGRVFVMVWTESSQRAFWIAKDAKLFHVDNEDSDQTARIRGLIWVFVGRVYQKVWFLWRAVYKECLLGVFRLSENGKKCIYGGKREK